MRPPTVFVAALLALCACAACNSSSQPSANVSNTSAAENRPQTVEVPPVSAAHGGAPAGAAGATAGAPAQAGGGPTEPSVKTPELDAKIAKLEAKGKAAGASEADKKALAAAYVERANAYRDAGGINYRFALGDFRRALRYDPSNAEAKTKMDEIVSIYQSMGRPVPNNGLDQ